MEEVKALETKDETALRKMLGAFKEYCVFLEERIEHYFEVKSIRGVLWEVDEKLWDIISLLEERL